ncbi:MAG: hypothetical protein LBL19_02195 [Spirochaetaceae bacterium]|jgi:hypothetical protein|nr:hypothetical protein [Spirochaetaceae bacterium]
MVSGIMSTSNPPYRLFLSRFYPFFNALALPAAIDSRWETLYTYIMVKNNRLEEEDDPETATLLELADEPDSSSDALPPDYHTPLGASQDEEAAHQEKGSILEDEAAEHAEAVSSGFPEITKRFEEKPHAVFNDPNYYKHILSHEGDLAQRIHTILQKYVNTKDPKDRSVFRQQLTTVYWDFLAGVALQAAGKLPQPKRFLLRFAILHPTFIDTETRNLFARAVVENELSQPVYYLDEWFKAVGNESIKISTTDEVQIAKGNPRTQFRQLLEKAKGKLEGARGLLKTKNHERLELEKALKERIKLITEHLPLEGLPEVNAGYDDSQKRVFVEIQDILKSLLKSDREMDSFSRDFFQAEEDVAGLQEKLTEESGKTVADVQAVATEFGTIRQMTKMTIGRQGNHFPILVREYFHSTAADVAFRENVIALLAWIESIDPEVFYRIYKNKVNRIVPYVILIPSYGDTGVCWEPFDRFNRATSRGRIAVPLYPRSLMIALLSAVADLRWQVAKEKASYYWMEEGLTGNYYQWFAAQKLKGDLKEYFIEDYITWMTKESEGTQKLDKEVRGIFWRYMPFSQAIKEKLKTRSLIYQELYQRDLNRAMSDGY